MSSSNSGSDGQAEDARKNGELGESGLAMEGLRIAREVPPDKSSAPAAAVGSQARKARFVAEQGRPPAQLAASNCSKKCAFISTA